MAAPEKSASAFRTISEVADELDVPQHVLRFWEGRFSQVKPLKRSGNRRYYRPEDVELLQAIRYHLYDLGYTIKGVQKLLKEAGPKGLIAAWKGDEAGTAPAPAPEPAEQKKAKAGGDNGRIDPDDLKEILSELKALRRTLDDL